MKYVYILFIGITFLNPARASSHDGNHENTPFIRPFSWDEIIDQEKKQLESAVRDYVARESKTRSISKIFQRMHEAPFQQGNYLFSSCVDGYLCSEEPIAIKRITVFPPETSWCSWQISIMWELPVPEDAAFRYRTTTCVCRGGPPPKQAPSAAEVSQQIKLFRDLSTPH